MPDVARLRPIALGLLPWLVFLAVLAAMWRITDLSHSVVAYGDVLEVTWGSEWYAAALRGETVTPFFYPRLFFPEGWRLAAFGYGPGMFLTLLPFQLLGGAAFAFNVVTLLSLGGAYAGAFLFTRRLTTAFPAVVAALLYTFWGFRWLRIMGHLNLALGTAALPWLLWSLHKAQTSPPRTASRWLLLAGGFWAYAISNSFYFAWIGGLLLLGWVGGSAWQQRPGWRVVARQMLLPTTAALLFSAPAILFFWRGGGVDTAASYSLSHINDMGANLNALPIPFVYHPQLQTIARRLYHGPIDPSGTGNFGLLATLLALAALPAAWRRPAWRPLALLLLTGIFLGLGPTLKWDGQSVQVSWLQPLNQALWQVGRSLKPALFAAELPPPPLANAVPLPWLWLAPFVPYWEGARVAARYLFVAALGVFPLAAITLQQVRRRWLQWGLSGLVLWETLSFVAHPLPYPPPTHAVFDWLRAQDLGDAGIIDLYPALPGVLNLAIRGETLWATGYYGHPTVSGASSIWPPHTAYLIEWFFAHPHPFQSVELAPLLRAYRVRYLLLHVQSEENWLAQAAANPAFTLVDCFPPAPAPSPWNYPVCVLSLSTSPTPYTNLLLDSGWSAGESWGVWASSAVSQARWVATAQVDHQLEVEAFPLCDPDRTQTLAVTFNGHPLTSVAWSDCQPTSIQAVIPAVWVEIGWNDLTFTYAYAASPAQVTNGQNPDPRPLSAGYNKLFIHRPHDP